ncbi:unnamed protein product, partial [Musa hybrid cultivar]
WNLRSRTGDQIANVYFVGFRCSMRRFPSCPLLRGVFDLCENSGLKFASSRVQLLDLVFLEVFFFGR